MMQEIRAVTLLRGCAAIIVVLFHAALDVRGRGEGSAFPPFLFGAAGVDIFFVLSGFVMVLSSAGRGGLMPVGRFGRRRIERIVPMYWIASLTTLTHQVLANRHSFLLDGWPRHLACSLAFIPCYQTDLPFVVQGWTLEYEMAFYGMFAVALAMGRIGAVRALMVFCLTAGLCAFGRVWSSDLYGSSSLLAEFGLGMAVAFWRPSGVGAVGAVTMILAGVLVLCSLESSVADPAAWRLLVWGVPATLVVAGCSCVPNATVAGAAPLAGRVGLLLGEASYSIYLFHILVFKVVGRPVLGLVNQGTAGLWAYFAIVSAAALGLGVAIHLFIERPVQARVKQLRRRTGEHPAGMETRAV